jgi:outer membrane protein OmpA-like peptidoglycan-associated protein
MPPSLLDSLNDLVTPDLLSRAASQLGESEGGIAKALGAAAPALLGALAARANDGNFIRQVFNLLTDPSNDGGVLRNPAAGLGAERSPLGQLSSQLLALALGGRTDGVAQAIARFAGIKPSSASTLLSVASPLVVGLLGARAKRSGIGPQDLASLLLGERRNLQAALPAGLAGMLGLDETPRPAQAASAPPARAGSRWLWPALIGLALIAGLWWLLRARAPEPPRVAEAPRPAAALPPVAAAPPVSRIVVRDLPGGVRIEVPDAGLETRLIALLEGSGPADEATWFEFDRISFETDSAQLRPESRAQLRDVAAILRAYPSIRVKIGGYTDSTGDPASNLQLSAARAESVRQELISQGLGVDRLDAEGYGAAQPVASNDTEEGRARNRRIALRVTER